jgi:hypothetical protein
MKEVFLPSFADEEDEVPEDHQGNDADEDDIQAEKVHVPVSCGWSVGRRVCRQVLYGKARELLLGEI